jgi:spermidine/putrescine-binding protein
MDWICYGTPISAAKDYIDPETVNDPVTYPDPEKLSYGSSYAYLPDEVTRFVESLFMEVRNS